jgi:hypothetical protein
VRRTASVALVIVACGAGFWLRLHDLARQSLWLDEGATFTFATMPVAKIIAWTFSSEPNPPLYYSMLHFWLAFAGASEFGLRSLSVWFGLATIVLTYRLGRDFCNESTGVVAALFVACSPFLIRYSQEARAFSLLAMCATGLLVAQLCALRVSTFGRWSVVALLATATLYSHFFGLFAVLTSWTIFVMACATRANMRAGWWQGLAAYGASLAIYLPWLAATLRAGAANTSWRAATSLSDMAWRTAVVAAHGNYLPEPWGTSFTWLCGALAIAGSLVAWRKGRQTALAGMILVVGVMAPTLMVWAVSHRQAIFAEPYVIAQVPIFLLAVAALGSYRAPLARAVSIAGVTLVVLVSLVAVRLSWTVSANAKEDFRLAATFLEQRSQADDAIVVVADYTAMPFTYYYRGVSKIVPFRGDFNRPGDFLDAQLAGADRVWLLLSHAEQVDPQGAVQRWMSQRFPAMTEAFPQGIQIRGYRITYRLLRLPQEAEPTNAHFGDGIELVGLTAESGIPAREALLRPPKDNTWLHVTLYLRRVGPIVENYRSVVRLVDSKGVWGETFDRPGDALLLYSTRLWQTGEIVADDVDVNINTKTPPGAYRLWVRILGPDGKDLPTGSGPVIVGNVTITPS